MSYYTITQNNESTVVGEYQPGYRIEKSYQTEAELEKALIDQLVAQGYEYLPIHTESDLIQNLRTKLEKFNNYTFTDQEWENFFISEISNDNLTIADKTASIQEDYIKILKRDDGTCKNIYLIDKQNIHKNQLQVIQQYQTKAEVKNRYDVTILVNGLPLVHIELKKRGVDLKEAFNQIDRYCNDSFWASTGLFDYVQIFVISNGTLTKYYSNTTRERHIKENYDGTIKKDKKRTSNSYEFTSWWADEKNKPIMELMDFASTFFAKHTLLNIITKYCVFTSDRLLLVMRPYQIVVTEKILNKIVISSNYKKYGTIDAGGYIWHTTGSGKTLTSFKTAQLASRLNNIEKVLFVVDRKDLDYQTMREYDKFEKGAANSNTSTAVLKKQLEDPNARIIITTIQKLERFIKANKDHTIYNGHIVIIFDECHRSQFGEMHNSIKKAFKKYHIFGFTGTPIFAENAQGGKAAFKTTDQVFGQRLHTYTIVDAIADRNVLPFKVDYVSTMREAEFIDDEEIFNIDREKVLSATERISKIVNYILEHFNQKTKRNEFYELSQRRLAGFNSIFAVSSIEMAKKYYNEFKKQLSLKPENEWLKIALIYSYSPDDDNIIDQELRTGMMEENSEDTNGLDQSSKDFLQNAINDYNQIFGTSYDITADKFQNYYKDISERMKNREIDLLIVVNMFLTGFDATTVNTLWVDKNLRMHGLLQAFSRTNRILNSVKTHGNIVCFRNLEEATNKALALFGDKDAANIVLIKSFKDYYEGYQEKDEKTGEIKEYPGYKQLIETLQNKFPLSERILGETNEKEFIKLYSHILKAMNLLQSFDEFEGKEILSQRDFQDYRSLYLDLYGKYRKSKDEPESTDVSDDIVFEIELIKQVEINIDYILELIKKYHQEHTKNKEALFDIMRSVNSSWQLRSKADLIEQFIKTLNPTPDVNNQWNEFIEVQRKNELNKIIIDEKLHPKETLNFIKNAFNKGYLEFEGTEFPKILPAMSRFTPNNERAKKREIVEEKLLAYFDRYYNISSKIFKE